MDKRLFVPNCPGRLVEIATLTGKDWSFIPDELPPRWTFAPRLWPLLVEAREALGTLNGIGQILPDPQLLLRPLQTREAITSSNIEGTYVTPQQLLLYELNPKESSRSTDRAGDWMEVHNYGLALKQGCELLQTLPICNRLCKSMHAALLRGVRGKNKAPGEFRSHQVQIGTNARFVPPPTGEVGRLMSNLENYINTDSTEIDKLVKCFIVHYQFETIHPFFDGNGRIGRAMLALMIYNWLGHSAPWLYMSAFYEKFRGQYVEYLFKVSANGDWTEWIEFCLQGAIQQARDSIRRCHEFKSLKNKFHEQVTAPTPRTHSLIESLFVDPIVRVSSLAKKLSVTYPTAKADIELLMKHGILSELPDTRPRTVYCSEVFRIAYQEDNTSIAQEEASVE